MEQKTFQELVLKAVKNRKRCGLLIVSRSDPDCPKFVFLHDEVTLFETMMTTMIEANRDKTKVPDYYYFFYNVSLVCFTAELDE